jgi:hypothetical protein
MPTPFICASAITALLCFSTLARAQTPIFNRVIGSGTPLPPNGSGLVVGGLPLDRSLLAARDGFAFAFMARNQLQQNGIYRYDSGVISRVAFEFDPTPDGTGTLTLFSKPLTISASNLAFVGYGLTNQSHNVFAGIYLVSDGITTEVVNNSTMIAGAPAPFSDFGNIDLSGDTVTFTGIITLPTETRYGVYRYRNSHLIRIADSGMQLPGGGEVLFATGNVSGGGGYSAFVGSSVTNSVPRGGVYLVNPSDQISVVADTHTMIPGSSQNFSGFAGNLAADGPDVAFVASDQGGNAGLYRRVSGMIQLIALRGQSAPGGGTIQQFGNLSLDDGHIAFGTQFDAAGHYGLYTDVGGPLRRIIATGDTLDGKTITQLLMSEDALEGNSLALEVGFSDFSHVLYIATVPEPTAIGLILACSFLLNRRRWDQHR